MVLIEPASLAHPAPFLGLDDEDGVLSQEWWAGGGLQRSWVPSSDLHPQAPLLQVGHRSWGLGKCLLHWHIIEALEDGNQLLTSY